MILLSNKNLSSLIDDFSVADDHFISPYVGLIFSFHFSKRGSNSFFFKKTKQPNDICLTYKRNIKIKCLFHSK